MSQNKISKLLAEENVTIPSGRFFLVDGESVSEVSEEKYDAYQKVLGENMRAFQEALVKAKEEPLEGIEGSI